MRSDVCTYYERNPDPQFSACRNTGFTEDGVTFDGVEPLEGIFTYIGRTSLIEAIGLLFDMSPKQVIQLLEGGTKQLRVKIGRLEEEKKFLADRLAEINTFILDQDLTPKHVEVIEPDGDEEPVIA